MQSHCKECQCLINIDLDKSYAIRNMTQEIKYYQNLYHRILRGMDKILSNRMKEQMLIKGYITWEEFEKIYIGTIEKKARVFSTYRNAVLRRKEEP